MEQENSKNKNEFQRLERTLVQKGSIIDYYVDTIKVPNGNIVKWDYIHHKGAVAVVPITKNGTILMVRQWRDALDRYTLEIPAGGLNFQGKEDKKLAAARELEEETGFYSEDLEFLINIRTTVAFSNEQIAIFVAKNLIETTQNLDEDEFIHVEEKTLKELLEMIYAGEIEDAKTISAIFAYKEKYLN